MSDLRSRSNLHFQLKKMLARVNKHETTPLTLDMVKVNIQRVETTKDKIDSHHNTILSECVDDVATAVQETAYEEIMETHEDLLEKLVNIQQALSGNQPSPSGNHRQQHVKLPEVQLPKFNGNYEDWISFSDLFKATVDSNNSLTSSLKLQYLKGCCSSGAAESLIRSLKITDDNYQVAWDLLEKNFNNKREIITTLVRKLLNQTNAKAESASHLQSILNTTMECVRSLTVMGQPVDKWDTILIVHLTDKLDSETRSEWAKTQTTNEPPTFKQFTEFIETHIRSLLAKGCINHSKSNSNSSQQGKPQIGKPGRQANIHHVSTHQTSCKLCSGQHTLNFCPKFLAMEPAQRMPAVKQIRACTNCLRFGHNHSTCYSNSTCKVCSKKHHTLLHNDNNTQNTNSSSSSNQSQSNTNQAATTVVRSNTSSTISNNVQVLLKTAIVHVPDTFGNRRPCRILLDDGSEASFITSRCAKALGLSRSPTNMMIQGISGVTASHVKWKINTTLYSRHHDASVQIEAFILPKVTGTLPNFNCDSSSWTHLAGLQLADETYHTPGEIDILLGADVVPSIMRDGRKTGPRNSPIAQNSLFGWVLAGKVTTITQSIIKSHHVQLSLEEIMHSFWELNEVPNKKPLTLEEMECENHFKSTFIRKPDGRYSVRLPFNNKINEVGETKELATRRLIQLERRFKKYPIQHQLYKEFMDEYLQLGHMEETKEVNSKSIFIPHHFVVKEDSTTTKLRVVFDASMKSSSGVSLNDALLGGPTIQEDLYTLLIRFRLYQIALKADIAKMYRQFEIAEEDRNYQCILWRTNETDPIKTFRLTTSTYGTKSAPFLATRCLNQLAFDEGDNYPEAAAAVLSSMYVDDLLGGADDVEEAKNLYLQTTGLCKSACLDIRKWCSNDNDVLSIIPESLQEHKSHEFDDNSLSIKALGIKWQPNGDYFHFSVNLPQQQDVITKREISSEIAKTFDPVGWLSPTTIKAKIILQDLWREKLDWDSPVTEKMKSIWDTYQAQLSHISKIKIPRKIIPRKPINYQLHGFADSSEKAYAAAVYLRCVDECGVVTCHLITSKTKVAPLKNTSLPRLELCAAHLLSETIEALLKCFTMNLTLHAWTDSMITLHWITSPSRRWKTFVANRVAAIQEIIPPRHWHHIRSEDNPADLPSRGIDADQLLNNSLWWHGPVWLINENFPSSDASADMNAVQKEEKEEKIHSLHTAKQFSYLNLMSKFSSLHKIVTTTAWLQRFIKFLKDKTIVGGPLLPNERKIALNKLINLTQQEEFSQEITLIKRKQDVQPKSKLLQLNPYLDSTLVLRVGGRLQNANLNKQNIHPIILPAAHFITTLLVQQYHMDSLHGGFTLVLSMLRRNYWILRGRDAVRHIIRKCIICRKVKAETQQQLMGTLPSARVQAHRPFLHCGVDFAGPFTIKKLRGRNTAEQKVYMCVYICFSTKAVHLEAVTSLSTDAFIQSFKRFIARRGIPSHMYSDCGTNFQGANNELQKLYKANASQLQHQYSLQGVTWIFNSPSAPHHGGLWEAAVKSAKYHMKRVIGPTALSLEQFQTLLCNIEACLNSRPLCAISSDPLDTDALTPGHFLIGQPLTSFPDLDTTTIPINRLDQWQHVTQMSQHFWRRWENEYLTTLQSRAKWNRKSANLAVGDLVVVKEDNLAPCHWRMGRIIAVFPGADGLVRKAMVKTKIGDFMRPITKLSLLLNNDE